MKLPGILALLSLLPCLPASAQILTVPGTAGPWEFSASLNPAFAYGFYGDQTAAALFPVSAGMQLSIEATGVIDADGAGLTFGPVGPNGDPGWIANDGRGFSGTVFPSYYTSADYPTNFMSLIGVFADASGAIIGSPFEIGEGPVFVTAPAGAVQLQMGINDDIFADNIGEFVADITVIPEPSSGLFLALSGMLFLRRGRRASCPRSEN